MLDEDIFGLLSKPFFVSAICCAVVLAGLLKSGLAWSLATDVPTHRSLHTRPTPRVGGWGLTPASALGIVYFAPRLSLLALMIVALGLLCQIDDRRGLSARIRFTAQTCAALALIILKLRLSWWLCPVAVLGLVWATNLYNFMDGADGLAGGMALIGFGSYSLAALHSAPLLAVSSAAIAGASAGFLAFNLPPAKLFLGDAGSIPLGFLAGSLGLVGVDAHVWPLWFPFVVFFPFVADASVTLTRRILSGERFWEAHRQHYYQRMIQMDNGHRRTVCIWYGLMLTCAALAFAMSKLENNLGIAPAAAVGGIWLIVLLLLGHDVDRRWKRFEKSEK